MASNHQIIFHLHCCALLLGGTALFSKIIPLDAVDIIIYRTLICGLILACVAQVLGYSILIQNRKRLAILLACSALFSIHWWAYFEAMQVSSVAVGIISMFTFPVMTVLIEPLFTGRRMKSIDLALALAIAVGIWVMIPEFELSNSVTLGVCLGLFSALAVSIRNIWVSQHLREISPIVVMSYHGLISALVLAPFGNISPLDIGQTNWLWLFLLATLFTAVPHTQITFGLLNRPAKTVSMIISLQVVYASFFAFFLLNETLTWQTLFGGSMILTAALIESFRRPQNH